MHKTCRQYKLCRSFTTSIYFKAQFNSCKHDSAVMLLGRLLQLSKKASFNWDLLMIHHSHTTLTCKFIITSGIFHIMVIRFMEDMVIFRDTFLYFWFELLYGISELKHHTLDDVILRYLASNCIHATADASSKHSTLNLVTEDLPHIYLYYIAIFHMYSCVCVARKSFL